MYVAQAALPAITLAFSVGLTTISSEIEVLSGCGISISAMSASAGQALLCSHAHAYTVTEQALSGVMRSSPSKQ